MPSTVVLSLLFDHQFPLTGIHEIVPHVIYLKEICFGTRDIEIEFGQVS